MGWLFANLFLLAIVLIGAAYTLMVFWLLKVVHLSENLFFSFLVSVVALIATYYTVKRLHRWIARLI